ncbi:hypothetical protein ACO1PK_03390 [Alishewanella sp. d11]|uniref:hypothetical protein n=1 Tax=Alishewanella sp. d11 TaxID=3414030 RepID=UPI003BF926BA
MQDAATNVSAAKRLANSRLANNELQAALYWFRHAASLGSADALEHALRLQLRLEGRLATAHWLQHIQPSLALSPSGTLLAELGLWPIDDSSSVLGWQSAAGCALVLQPVISQAQGERTWQSLMLAWQQDPQLTKLPVCFKPVLRFNSTELNCTEQLGQRINCNYAALTSTVMTTQFQQLVVIAGRGIASYNNGILQLPDNAGLPLFRHEFMHIAGFLDEYLLSPVAAKAICQPGKFAPNLLIGNDPETLQRYLLHYAVRENEVTLTAVPTCEAVGLQAYRPVAAINTMRHFEAGLPDLYEKLLLQVMQKPAEIMPVQYYFAYLARQKEDWQQWLQLMQAAATLGYPPAQHVLRDLTED